MVGEMNFSLGDVYPALSNLETGHKATPDAEDQQLLNENKEVSEAATNKGSRPMFVWLAILVVILLVVFFGAGA